MHRIDFRKLGEKPRNVYNRYKKAILISIVILSMALAVLVYNSLSITFESTDELRSFVQDFGPFAPLIIILIMLVELLFLPLPASVIAITNGAIFGVVLGTLYSYIAYVTVSIIAFFLSRRFGRPFIEKIIKPGKLEMYDQFFRRKGKYALWFAYIFPFFPNVIINFVIGLSRIRFRSFMLYPLIGYIPNLIILNTLGDFLFRFGLDIKLLLFITVMIALLIIFYSLVHKRSKSF